MSYYVILRGPLGAGKSTVASALAEALGGEVVSIDAILETLDWDGGSEELFLAANRIVEPLIRDVLARGRPAIVDGNFYWASEITDLESRLAAPHRVFRLKVPLDTCIARDAQRSLSYGAEATREVFEKVERVQAGIPVDGTFPIPTVVEAIRSQLPLEARFAHRVVGT